MRKTYTRDELKEILKRHQKWLAKEEGGERANLKGADLSWANLREADLSGVDLRGANLSNADLSGVDLRNACLDNAKF